MTEKNYLFTSESVSEGHPDKVCDRISDMVVDSYLSKDPFSRVACETLTTTNKVVLAGEIRGPNISKDEIIEISEDENLTSTPVSSSNTDQKDQNIEQEKTAEFNPDEIIEISEDENLTSTPVSSSNTDQKDQDKT